MMPHPQDEVQSHSLADPSAFWSAQAAHLHWHKKPTSTLTRSTKKLKSGTSHDHWEWFAGGEISTCYNCVDRHVEAGNGEQTAIIWDSPVTGSKSKISYKELQKEVETFAGVLREEGVRKGDVVLIYSELAICVGVIDSNGCACSAHDSCGSHWYPRHLSNWCHTRGSLWWIRTGLPRSAYRCFKARRNPHGFLWNRRCKTTHVIQTLHHRSHTAFLAQTRKDDNLAARSIEVGRCEKGAWGEKLAEAGEECT
jgi:hypothetical protein